MKSYKWRKRISAIIALIMAIMMALSLAAPFAGGVIG